MADLEQSSRRAAETAARNAYGRLLGILAARTRDIAAAEDALSDAFAAALSTWPSRGIPDNPDAWLLSAAKRKLIDQARRAATADAAEPDLITRMEDAAMDSADPEMPDPRLGLMFLCAHPAIAPAVRTPLMLQTVLGLTADRIAAVYLVASKTMSARLVRAKAKIKAAGIPFGIPGPEAWVGRLDAVLSAVYGAYTAGLDAGSDASSDLRSEAEWLARLLVEQLPESGECKGLLSLILFCEARRGARLSADGHFIPLSDQDMALWDGALTVEANALLRQASRHGDGGRYQIEAAIQSVHALRAVTGETDWAMLLRLYDALMVTAPSMGAAIARAAVMAEAIGPHEALDALSELPEDRLADHCPYHATRAHCLAGAGRVEEAHAAYTRAAELAPDPAARSWLAAKATRLLS